MRSMERKGLGEGGSALVLAFCIVAASAAATDAKPKQHKAACEAASVALAHSTQGNHNVQIAKDELGRVPTDLTSGIAWSGRVPSATLLKRFAESHWQNALICKSVTLTAKEIETSSAAAAAQDRSIVRITLPVVSDNGNEALSVVDTSNRPGLSGHRVLLLLERKGAGWVVVGSQILSLS